MVLSIMAKASETALLVVNGQEFRDWETIMVRHAKGDVPPFRFRFTCSEANPISKNFSTLQIKPGDVCQVYLAGQLAISGKVSTRQVFMDKARHYVELQGATYTLDLAGATAITKTMEFKDVTFDQFAQAILKPFGIPYKVEGGQTPQLKFPRISMPHGVSVFDLLDEHARNLGISFSSDPQGAFVAIVGPNNSMDVVEEGVNALELREILYNPAMETSAPAIAQGPGSDKQWGADVASVPFVTQQMAAFAKGYMPSVIPMELPTISPDHMKGRASTERNWQAEDQITALITVQGWLRQSGGLWQRNQQVHVKAPSLILDMPLTAKSVTFTQDNNGGTRTVLELCNPAAMGGLMPQMQ